MVRSLLANAPSIKLVPTTLPSVFCRHKSLTAAIERGIRSSEAPRRYREDRTNSPSAGKGSFRDRTASSARAAPWTPPSLQHRNISRGSGKERWRHRESEGQYPPRRDDREHRQSRESGYAPKVQHGERLAAREHKVPPMTHRRPPVPESLPYTTAASEFLYGYSVVFAALKGGRRKLYNLYIHNRGAGHEGVVTLLARARRAGVKIHEVGDEYLRVLDKASSGRPHNGFILEASPLPQPPITKLGQSSVQESTFMVSLDKQSREDREVNGMHTHYAYRSSKWRHPLVLYVDGVLDEGNLGAIARSAYFLGVDAIATPTRQSAPWSQIALKASAGAAEAIPVFRVNRPSEFLAQSAQSGWRIYASDSIPPEEQPVMSLTSAVETPADDLSSKLVYTYARSSKRVPLPHYPVDAHPTILMMGAEGEGLRSSLLNQANYKVGIRAGRKVDEIGVDSLNVSVAASLLCYEFLQKPKEVRKTGDRLF